MRSTFIIAGAMLAWATTVSGQPGTESESPFSARMQVDADAMQSPPSPPAKPTPTKNEVSDPDAGLKAAYAEIAAARADMMQGFKAACGDRRAYLEIFEMVSDRDRELMKETCAHRHAPARRKRLARQADG